MIKKFYFIGKKELFSLCRSITGNGTKKTLKIIKKNFSKLKIKKIRSGHKVFDWKIPPEWNIKDAYIIDKNKKKIVDFKKNNLHIINYSTPTNLIINKKQLLKKLYTNPGIPDAIPYITSYYKKNWGFCVTENFKKKFKKKYFNDDKFLVVIKSKFNPAGKLVYGEYFIKGKSKQEILISTYICHPSMANNELSGIIVSMALINYFKKFKNLNKGIRFLFVPETIGSIAYLEKNYDILKKKVIGGYNLSCIGDERNHSCMLSKYGNSVSDRCLLDAYKKLRIRPKIYSYLKRGSDERQYNSPGIDLNIASIFRTKYGEFKEYHTSLDNFNLVTKRGLLGGFKVAKNAISNLQNKIIPKNKILCEPNMGKRNLYPLISGVKGKQIGKKTRNIMNFLTYADGKNELEVISSYIKKNYLTTKKIYDLLIKRKLII